MGLFDKFKKKENNNVSNEEKNNVSIDIEQAKKDKQVFIYNQEVSIKKIREINKLHNINLDYSLHSISILMELISNYQIKYKNKDFDDDYLSRLFTILGIYLGDTLLKNGIAEKGGIWCVPSEIPNSNIVLCGNSGNAILVVVNGEKATIIKPIDKIKQYWENGSEDNLLSFCKSMLEMYGIKHDINNVNNGIIIISQIENQ